MATGEDALVVRAEGNAALSNGACHENIKVFIRIRPLLGREIAAPAVTEVSEDGSTVRVETDLHNVNARFDHVFDLDSSQEEVYAKVRFAAESVVQGFNSTIFAYGQTGSGKSFTMFGPEDDLSIYGAEETSRSMGVIPRAVREVLAIAESERSRSGRSQSEDQEDEEVSIYCSFMQIYNDQPFDLLRDPGRERPLQVHENTETKEIYVVGLSEYAVTSLHECMALLEQGDEQRACRQTQMNDRRKKRSGRVVRAKLNLVDLAGSEKWGTMEQLDKGHVSELTNINTSLHTLGRCIAALTNPKATHVPFRDSKLTRILQDALGGNSRTCIIATLSPSEAYVEESISTLKFADRAKRVMQHAHVVETREVSLELVLRLEAEIGHLRQLLDANGIPYDNKSNLAAQGALVVSHLQDQDWQASAQVATPLALMDGSAVPSPGTNSHALALPSAAAKGNASTSFAIAKELFDAKESIARLEQENRRLRDEMEAGATPRKMQAAIAVAKNEAAAASAGVKSENKRLRATLASLKHCADKFFAFEVEEEEFQTEFKRHLASCSTLGGGSGGSGNNNGGPAYNGPISLSPRAPATGAPATYRLRGMGDRVEHSGPLGSKTPNECASPNKSNKKKTKSMTAQGRSLAQEERNVGSGVGLGLGAGGGVDGSTNGTRSLASSLREKQKELAKHKKLQQWIAAKAQRELERLEEDRKRDEEDDKDQVARDAKFRKHASFVKQKLRNMKNRARVADAPSNADRLSPTPQDS
ncbi:Kinesin-related protein 5 [Hondaea fermentalgiana]|uniref:Kinesin-like protein n=1 Tax=Hondaea fermentalgiana TaxID=2315210 RepID=A0A2R5GAB8_9STRA|nr:Kinesin-related protein 5 [Hondaea fermentalgiana]|eukprot:GBG27967.1 Kinesin-related protein 5 [Hondaea fermentalgiana]